ncbi:gem-associated protein 5-like protein [Dinothrombium tinctorium]|uniref:Gem-associated protein 5-like protein n=1 Tax=Dinothrombium tinctorium TaxID=1965070 RepID=A0A3S3PI57_9ACAR|nr:gem-associated protein 5-like protein [Dinothrombium tinctorium]RWS15716.1 gem-associated protein 5-like protein [Dinothrombium tinctorium]RWS15724.1 gem-associated protein 5-like protein [Dinothrombium tinctorium]
MNSELSIGPFFNWFNPKCSDVWTSSVYFKQNSTRKLSFESGYFKKPPICFWAYGAKNSVILTQIQGSFIRFLDAIKVYSNQNEKVTTVSFARDHHSPKVFIGSDLGSPIIYDFERAAFTKETVEHLTEEKILRSRKITCSEWKDHENVFYAIDALVVHWNIRTGVIEHVVIGDNNHHSRRGITAMVISKVDPFLLAVGYEGGEVVVVFLNNNSCRDGGILLQFSGHHYADICSLAFPFELGGYQKGLLASMSRDGCLSVYDLYNTKMLIDYSNDCKKVTHSKDRNYFSLAFVPPACATCQVSHYNDRPRSNHDDDGADLDLKNFQLLFTTSNGEMLCMYVPKYPPSSAIKRPKVVEFDRQKNHFHNNVVFNIAVAGPYDYGTKSRNYIDFYDSPQLAISISLDRQAILWDLKEKKARSVYPTFSHQIHDFAFNQFDPSTLAIASGEGLKLWKIASNNENSSEVDPYRLITIRKNLPTNTKLMTVAWNPTKDKQLATGTDDGQIFVVDVGQSKPSMKYSHTNRDRQKTQIYTLIWGPLPSNPYSESEPLMALYCILSGGKFKIHVPTTSKIYDFSEISDSIKPYGRTEAAWRDDYTLLAVGNEDGTIELYENSQKESILKLIVIVQSIHSKLILCLRWHPLAIYEERTNSNNTKATSDLEFWLASTSHDTKIQIIDFRTALEDKRNDEFSPVIMVEPIRTLMGHIARVNSIAWSTLREGYLASCSYDSTVQIWDAKHGVPLANYRGHSSRLFTVVWSSTDPDLVYSGGDDNTLHVWRPSLQKTKVPPTSENSSFDPMTRKSFANGKKTEEQSFVQWPTFKENEEEQIKEIEKRINDVKVVESETCKTVNKLHLHEGGDEISVEVLESEKQNIDSEQSSNLQNFEVSKNRKPTQLTKKLMNAMNKESKKKSLFPLTNIVENSSAKQQHFQDIDYLLAHRNDRNRRCVSDDDASNRTLLYGNAMCIKELLRQESKNHRQQGNLQSAYAVELLHGDIKQVIKEAVKRHELSETLVAISASVSRTFWFETVEAYTVQLENQGDYIMAAEYLMSIHKIKEAINLLREHGLHKEALVIAKSRFPYESEIVLQLMKDLAKDKESVGNYEAAVKCLIAIGNDLEAATMLAKRADFSSLFYASHLCKESGNLQQFHAYFGQALKEGCLKEISEIEMKKLFNLWNSVDERLTFESFFYFYRSFTLKLESDSDIAEENENNGSAPLSCKTGIDHLSRFLGVGIQTYVYGNKDVTLRVAFHLFLIKSFLDSSFDKDDDNAIALHAVAALETILSANALKEEMFDDSVYKRLFDYICSLLFRNFSSYEESEISQNIDDLFNQKFGCQLQANAALRSQLVAFCVYWYLQKILDSVRNGDKKPFGKILICSHHEVIIDETDDKSDVISCDSVKLLLQCLKEVKNATANAKSNFDRLISEFESLILKNICCA